MNERFFITIPASLLLWAAALILFSWSLNHEIERPLQGRDMVTVHIAMQAHQATAPQTAKPVPPPPPPAPQKKEPVSKLKPKPPEPKPEKHEKEKEPSAPAMPEQRLSEEKSENDGAVILYQPLPKIPDDLRREAFRATAIARFHVAADGAATVELVTPAQNPRLNQLLMASLRTWKFRPAVEGGRPVSSTFTIRVHFKVE